MSFRRGSARVAIIMTLVVASAMFAVAPRATADPPSGYVAGISTLLPTLTTGTEQVYANPDGSQTAFITSTPTRSYDPVSGLWRPLNLALVSQADGSLVANWNPGGARLLPGGDVAVTTSAGNALVHHSGAATGIPQIVDRTATYGAALAGADLVISLQVDGFEESVVLPNTSSPGVYDDEITLPPGVVAEQAGDSIQLVDANGLRVAGFGGGQAHDAAGAEVPVRMSVLSQVGQVATVSAAVDPSWLTAPQRVAPVTIDPVWAGNSGANGFDTYVNSDNCSGDYSGLVELRAGSDNRGRLACGLGAGTLFRVARSYLRFNVPIEAGSLVTSAKLYLVETGTPVSTVGTDYQVFALRSAPTSNTNWSNQPGSSVTGDVQFLTGPGVYTWNITPLAINWVRDPANNFGVGLNAIDETSGSTIRTFNSGQAAQETPTLQLTYTGTSSPPPPPSSPAQPIPNGDDAFDNGSNDSASVINCMKNGGRNVDLVDIATPNSANEVAAAHSGGDWVVEWQGFDINAWADPNNGTTRGQQAVTAAHQSGYPAGSTLYLDVEKTGSASRSTIMSWIQNWAAVVNNAGFEAGVYLGAPNPLTVDDANQLDSSNTVKHFWESVSSSSHLSTARGYQIVQTSASSSACSSSVDYDRSQVDSKGSRSVGWAP